MKKILASWGLGLYGIFCIVEGIVNKNWIDLTFGLLLGGSGGASLIRQSESRTRQKTPISNDPDLLANHPNRIKSKFSLLSRNQKIGLAALIAVLVVGIGGALNQKATNTAKAASAAQQQFLNSLKGKSPNEINLIACKQADTSFQTIFKGGSKGKSVGDAINMFNRSAKDMNDISNYAVGPIKISFSNMAATSSGVALTLDKNVNVQNAAIKVLTAARADLTQACIAIGY